MNIDFLQSEEWRKFQESVGRRTFFVSDSVFHASIIEHKLPIAGRYFYIPRGIIFNFQFSIFNDQIKNFFSELLVLAKKEKAGWVRLDVENEEILNWIKNNSLGHQMSKLVKAPHDMQPKEIFIVDISKTEEELLKEMKEKTRYNIRLAEKKGVSLRIINQSEYANDKKYSDEFLRLIKMTSARNRITAHPENYYRQMLTAIPPEMIKLYVAEYQGKVIAANVVIFYGDMAIYLHGASDNEYRNVMAPYLLQWRAIQDAKKAGCVKYDFGGVSTKTSNSSNSWSGITKFKTGFSSQTKPVEFFGSYDMVINPVKYYLYRVLQKIKEGMYGLV